MRAKDFFRQVSRAEKELVMIRAKLDRYSALGRAISGAGLDTPVVTHSLGESRVESAAIGLYDAAKELEEKMQELLGIIRRAEAVIERIPQERYRQILTLRYIAGWTFRSISDELRYQDEKSVYRAHGWALSEAQKILSEQEAGK